MIKTWIYRNAREIELSIWKYHFEGGTKEDVVLALSHYQNEDGGFGNSLEPDSWNPNSTPYTTLFAIGILEEIEFIDFNHSIYKGIFKYLYSEKDLMEYGWKFNVPTNDNYPHAPWWTFNEEENYTESIGVTAGISTFVLKYADKNSALYQRVISLVKSLLDKLLSSDKYGEMGISKYIRLVDTMKELGFDDYDYTLIQKRLGEQVSNSIERDASKWQYYGIRPSKYIKSPKSVFYNDNKDIVDRELEYLIETLPQNDVWGITWSWFDNNEKYAKEFAISENWWKSSVATGTMRFLRNFGYIEA